MMTRPRWDEAIHTDAERILTYQNNIRPIVHGLMSLLLRPKQNKMFQNTSMCNIPNSVHVDKHISKVLWSRAVPDSGSNRSIDSKSSKGRVRVCARPYAAAGDRRSRSGDWRRAQPWPTRPSSRRRPMWRAIAPTSYLPASPSHPVSPSLAPVTLPWSHSPMRVIPVGSIVSSRRCV